jgi:hypothetical protein
VKSFGTLIGIFLYYVLAIVLATPCSLLLQQLADGNGALNDWVFGSCSIR